MKHIALLTMICGLALTAFAADNIYRGNSKDAKDLVCCYQGGKFFSDTARKIQIYHHPGNMVSKEAKATVQNCLYRFMSDKIYKGSSTAKTDCIASFMELKTKKGNALEAKIFEGFVVPRDIKKTYDKASKTDTVTSYKLTGDGINEITPKVLFTIADNKIFRGDSKNPKDCLLTFTGEFNSSRLLFMAIELTK